MPLFMVVRAEVITRPILRLILSEYSPWSPVMIVRPRLTADNTWKFAIGRQNGKDINLFLSQKLFHFPGRNPCSPTRFVDRIAARTQPTIMKSPARHFFAVQNYASYEVTSCALTFSYMGVHLAFGIEPSVPTPAVTLKQSCEGLLGAGNEDSY